jgi:hypothetical protein
MTTAAEAARDNVERRSERRMRTLKQAKIVFNLGHSVFDCTLRNLSPSGALIEVQSMVGIPARFALDLDHGAVRRDCTVRWHTERLIGVHFDDAVQKAV